MHRLPERIRNKIRIDPETGCWLWVGSIATRGYGQVSIDGRMRQIHRVVYELLVGPIPEGHQLDHVHARGCRHKNCAWPEHLEPVTNQENTRRAKALITHCPHGHEYSPENTRVTQGRRFCKACSRRASRESKRRKRARHSQVA